MKISLPDVQYLTYSNMTLWKHSSFDWICDCILHTQIFIIAIDQQMFQ